MHELISKIKQRFPDWIHSVELKLDECTIDVFPQYLKQLCLALRNEPEFQFEMLIDICGVDYSKYGIDEWETDSTTHTGFSRGVEKNQISKIWNKPRFAVVYHLLSLSHNQRLRLRCFVPGEIYVIDSVVDVWKSANWFEREAFDLFGIIFDGHPDLRRILTDYGFIGHPFRKDFPVSGEVEVRYDAKQQRVIYQPVEVNPRVLVPKVIRNDHRYDSAEVNNG